MAKPPKPDPTDPGQHAPGVSKTLEENAANSRRTLDEADDDRKSVDHDLTEERERV